jgi:hypothetical protein
MEITIHFYSYFKDLTGCAQTKATVLPGGTIGEPLKQLITTFPKLGPHAEFYADRRWRGISGARERGQKGGKGSVNSIVLFHLFRFP